MEAPFDKLRNYLAGLLNQARVSPADSHQSAAEQQHVTVQVSVRDGARLSQVKLEPEQTGAKLITDQLLKPADAGSAAYDASSSSSSSSSSPAGVPAWAAFSNRKALDVSVHGSFGGKLDVPLPYFCKERRMPEDYEHLFALSHDSSMLAVGECRMLLLILACPGGAQVAADSCVPRRGPGSCC
jgi:hypothetical protein